MINDVARKLRRLRKQAGLSQADVAKELDLTVTGYGHCSARSITMFLSISPPSYPTIAIVPIYARLCHPIPSHGNQREW